MGNESKDPKSSVLSESASRRTTYLYILRTADNQLYIGVSSNPEKRKEAHWQRKGALFTKTHRNGVIVHVEQFSSLALARKREIQLKKWSRAKKEALIAGNIAQLKRLSICRQTG